jgi:hypothetical protein
LWLECVVVESGSVAPKFFGKESMEEVASTRDIGNYFDPVDETGGAGFKRTPKNTTNTQAPAPAS